MEDGDRTKSLLLYLNRNLPLLFDEAGPAVAAAALDAVVDGCAVLIGESIVAPPRTTGG